MASLFRFVLEVKDILQFFLFGIIFIGFGMLFNSCIDNA